jgi:hypothetical protein
MVIEFRSKYFLALDKDARQEIYEKRTAECSYEELALKCCHIINVSGIHYADIVNRLFLPSRTGMPSPDRLRWEALRPDNAEHVVRPEERAELVDIASTYFRKLSKDVKNGGFLGRMTSRRPFSFSVVAAASDNASALVDGIADTLHVTPVAYTNGSTPTRFFRRTLPYDTVIRTGDTAVKAIRGLRGHGMSIGHFAALMDLEFGGEERIRRECPGVGVHTLVKRHELFMLEDEANDAYLPGACWENIRKYRASPVQFSIEYVRRQADSLESSIIIPQGHDKEHITPEEALTRMFTRLSYENHVLVKRHDESDSTLHTRRTANQGMLYDAFKAHFGKPPEWWTRLSAFAATKPSHDLECLACVPPTHDSALWRLEKHITELDNDPKRCIQLPYHLYD